MTFTTTYAILLGLLVAVVYLARVLHIMGTELRAYRPVVQAYLEAKAKAGGVAMQVPTPEQPGGKAYPPFSDAELQQDEMEGLDDFQ